MRWIRRNLVRNHLGGRGLHRATANFSVLLRIHERKIQKMSRNVRSCNREERTAILAFVVTLRRGQRRAKFTMPRESAPVHVRSRRDDCPPLISSDDAPH